MHNYPSSFAHNMSTVQSSLPVPQAELTGAVVKRSLSSRLPLPTSVSSSLRSALSSSTASSSTTEGLSLRESNPPMYYKEHKSKVTISTQKPLPRTPSGQRSTLYVSAHISDPCTTGALTHRLEPCGHLVITTQPETCGKNCQTLVCQYANPKSLDESFVCPICLSDHLEKIYDAKKTAFQKMTSSLPCFIQRKRLAFIAIEWKREMRAERQAVEATGRHCAAVYHKRHFE